MQVSDDFNRPDENPLNPAFWSVGAGSNNPLEVVSNACTVIPVHNLCVEACIAAAFPSNQFSQVTIVTLGNAVAGPCVRIQSGDNTNYYTLQVFGPINTVTTVTILGSGGLTLATGSFTVNSGDVFRLEAIGSNLTAYQNGSAVLTAVDSTFIGGAPGLQALSHAGTAEVALDAWVGGDFAVIIPTDLTQVTFVGRGA